MAYNKEVKVNPTYSNSSKETDSWSIHLYPALLCEDGSYLLQETGKKINLEWNYKKVTE